MQIIIGTLGPNERRHICGLTLNPTNTVLRARWFSSRINTLKSFFSITTVQSVYTFLVSPFIPDFPHRSNLYNISISQPGNGIEQLTVLHTTPLGDISKVLHEKWHQHNYLPQFIRVECSRFVIVIFMLSFLLKMRADIKNSIMIFFSWNNCYFYIVFLICFLFYVRSWQTKRCMGGN